MFRTCAGLLPPEGARKPSGQTPGRTLPSNSPHVAAALRAAPKLELAPTACYASFMSRLSALEILRRIKPRLQGRYPLSRLALFGSTARGEASEGSDIDVLVEVDPSIGLRFVDLAAEIEEALGHPADVVSRRAIDHARWEAIQPELADA